MTRASIFLQQLGDASFVGPGSTRRLLRRLLTKPLVPRVLAHSGDDPYRIAKQSCVGAKSAPCSFAGGPQRPVPSPLGWDAVACFITPHINSDHVCIAPRRGRAPPVITISMLRISPDQDRPMRPAYASRPSFLGLCSAPACRAGSSAFDRFYPHINMQLGASRFWRSSR